MTYYIAWYGVRPVTFGGTASDVFLSSSTWVWSRLLKKIILQCVTCTTPFANGCHEAARITVPVKIGSNRQRHDAGSRYTLVSGLPWTEPWNQEHICRVETLSVSSKVDMSIQILANSSTCLSVPTTIPSYFTCNIFDAYRTEVALLCNFFLDLRRQESQQPYKSIYSFVVAIYSFAKRLFSRLWLKGCTWASIAWNITLITNKRTLWRNQAIGKLGVQGRIWKRRQGSLWTLQRVQSISLTSMNFWCIKIPAILLSQGCLLECIGNCLDGNKLMRFKPRPVLLQ